MFFQKAVFFHKGYFLNKTTFVYMYTKHCQNIPLERKKSSKRGGRKLFGGTMYQSKRGIDPETKIESNILLLKKTQPIDLKYREVTSY